MVENSTIKIRDTAGQSLMYKSFVCRNENKGGELWYTNSLQDSYQQLSLCVFYV